MKISATLILSVFISFSGISQSYIDSQDNKQLWGEVTLGEFQEAPFSEWYIKNSEEHQITLTPSDRDLFKDLKVKVFIGSWCGDTKFLFPRFIKSWEKMGLKEDQLEIIALHHEKELYKQGPNEGTKGLDIHRVPTFIFYDEDKEIGRIVERTVFDIETDMKLIAEGAAYKHRYQAVPIVSELVLNNPDSLDSETFLKSAIKKSERELSTEAELNVYAYTLFFAGEMEKAKFIFKLNKELFPYDPYVAYGYGRILHELKDHSNAKTEFMEAIRIKPDFERAIKYLHEINELLKT